MHIDADVFHVILEIVVLEPEIGEVEQNVDPVPLQQNQIFDSLDDLAVRE